MESALVASSLGHNFSRCDGSVGSEFLAETLIVNGVVQVLHVEVDALIAIQPLDLHLLKLTAELRLSLVTLLSPSNKKNLAIQILAVHVIASLLSGIWIFVADKAEATRLCIIGLHDLKRNIIFFGSRMIAIFFYILSLPCEK